MKTNNSTKLELGCGPNLTEGYLHQDITSLPGTNLDFICNPWELPISESSLDEVLALGVMEHLRFEEFHKTLKHINKLLKPGGEFLFDVPDMAVWSEYLFNITHGSPEKNPLSEDHVWKTIYGWQRWPGDEHKSGWTKESLKTAVYNAGYSKQKEGLDGYLTRGIRRGRFTRPGDAHIYMTAIK